MNSSDDRTTMQTVDELARIIGRKRTDCPAVRRAAAECAAGWRLVDAVPPLEAQRRYTSGYYPAAAKAVTLACGKPGYAGIIGVFVPSGRPQALDSEVVE